GIGATASFIDGLSVGGGGSSLSATVRVGEEFWNVSLSAPSGQELQPGTYSGAQRSPDGTHPGLDMFGDGRGCNQTYGSFVVNKIREDINGVLAQLDVKFEQHCESLSAPPLTGWIRLNANGSAPVDNGVTLDFSTPLRYGNEGSAQFFTVVSSTAGIPTGTVTVETSSSLLCSITLS